MNAKQDCKIRLVAAAGWAACMYLSINCGLAQEAQGPNNAPQLSKDPGILSAVSFRSADKEQPTYVKSDTLTVNSKARIFTYNHNVEMKHGDLTLTCDTLQGIYNENNQIEKLVAQNNVIIEKGQNIRASGQRAVYEAATEIFTLTESPELQESGSVLTADTIKIFMREDRASAEGQVRVKIVKRDTASATKPPLGSSATTPMPASKKGKKDKRQANGKKKK